MIKIELNNKFWQYEPSNRIGKPGGFGEVYKGIDEKGEMVAIKKIHQHVIQEAHREINIVSILMKHHYNNIINIHDAGKDTFSGTYYIIMDLAEMNLSEHIGKTGFLNEQQSLLVILDIANGLKEADNIIHRDIKPENILYHNNSWKLADFGIARAQDAATSINTLNSWMSEQYAAPEQWKGLRATKTTDVYSLGCVCYYILTGNPPFINPNIALRDQHLYYAPREIKNISTQLHSLITNMLNKGQQERPNIETVVIYINRITSVR